MGRLFSITRVVLTGTFFIFLLGGCAVYDRFLGVEVEEAPEQIMSDGLEKLEKGRYEAATESFQKIKDRYPYSKFAITAELKMADSLYETRSFDEAFEAYDEFEKLHPKNEHIPYVIYQKGMCHFQQLKTIDRDQSHTLMAKEAFERLVNRFPRDDYANKARKNIRKCLIYLAEYELYVGHFYFRMENYRAALERYIYIIKNYPDMGQYHEALGYIARCKEALAAEKNLTEENENRITTILKRLIPY